MNIKTWSLAITAHAGYYMNKVRQRFKKKIHALCMAKE
jgi:hypothetical protein